MSLGAQARAAMPAGVVEGPRLPIRPAHHDDRIGADLKRQKISWLLQLARVAGEQPLAGEDAIEIKGVSFRRAIEGAFQRMARRSTLKALSEVDMRGGVDQAVSLQV
jgi:hypothetical protein